MSLERSVLIALVLLLSAVAPASAQQRAGDLVVSGSITVTWQGDPARGCAAVAMCDVSGRTVLPVQARGRVFAYRPRGAELRVFGFVIDERTASVARVTRAGGGLCVDSPSGPAFGPGGLAVQFVPAGDARLDVVIRPSPELSAGRCAGPLETDLERALPRARVAVAKVLAGRTRIDLSGRRGFGAGVFVGQVSSDLVVDVGSVSRPRGGPSGRRVPPPRRPSRYRRVVRIDRTLAVDYRVAAVRGKLSSAFAGLPGPGCELLDACGVTGATTIAPETGAPLRLRGRGRLPASGPGTVAGALRDLRAGRLRVGASFGMPSPARIAGETRREGVPVPCTDATGRGGLRLQTSANRLSLAVSLRAVVVRPSLVVLRSRCPGPGISAESVIAEGALPLERIGDERITLRLAAAGADAAPGYDVRQRSGEVVLELRRTAARVGTQRRVRMVRR